MLQSRQATAAPLPLRPDSDRTVAHAGGKRANAFGLEGRGLGPNRLVSNEPSGRYQGAASRLI